MATRVAKVRATALAKRSLKRLEPRVKRVSIEGQGFHAAGLHIKVAVSIDGQLLGSTLSVKIVATGFPWT